jgi:hypothetical protein
VEAPPHFIIGGAPRSGTTWLYEVLRRHPEIYLAQPVRPEPKFFLVDSLYAKGLACYREQWFSQAPPGRVAGEKSTNYLEGRETAARIARDLPAVKLVFILREPADRAYSNYLWSRMNGREPESFERALQLEDERERTCPVELRFARPHAYFSRGLYARLLRPFFERFRRDQILCLRYEDIARRRAELITRLHRFLGVAPREADADKLGIINAASTRESDVAAQLDALRARYAAANRELAELLGDSFQVWPG